MKDCNINRIALSILLSTLLVIAWVIDKETMCLGTIIYVVLIGGVWED